MSFVPPAGGGDRRRLLALLERLGAEERATLLAFAEFLAARSPTLAERNLEPPRLVARPPGESVVGAIRRLSATYAMLDRRRLLNVTSSLMTQHILQGRAAADVIDELERTFAAHYEELVAAGRREEAGAAEPPEPPPGD